ncbi:MAG: MBL fold hydrolase [Herpetosiphonaceae bacterium]|nr:MAG: MBL fold hydrolase [Herpetosiphonaceae bacterium]
MLLRAVFCHELAQISYLIGCQATGEALVVDPNRDVEQYIEIARREGLRITAVTETHIHADYVSGVRELALRLGARPYLSGAGSEEWRYRYAEETGAVCLHDGDDVMVGNIRLDVIHTPGHTPEHISLLITDTRSADRPMGILTGDFVFVGDVGRPDLLERAVGAAGSMQESARQLFRSLQRFKQVPDYVQVWPAHGAGSACGKALGAVMQSTVGYERLFNWALAIDDEDGFIQAVLEGQPDPPTYFAQMKQVNRDGPRLRPAAPPARLSPALLSGDLQSIGVIVDVRSSEAYAACHIPGTLNIPWGRSFLTWAGWLLPYDRPIALIADETLVQPVQQILQLIGIDDLAGYWAADDIASWGCSGRPYGQIERCKAQAARPLLELDGIAVLDVRTAAEYAAGHLPGSINIPLGYLPGRLDELPQHRPILVHCESGLRSAIAASILISGGCRHVIDLCDGFRAWRTLDYPIVVPSS